MALDANTLAALAYELDCKLRGGRIDKIYQMSRSSVLLTLRSLGENYRLLLSCDASKGRICLTKQTFENPDMQSSEIILVLMKRYPGTAVSSSTATAKSDIRNIDIAFSLTE